MVVAFSAAALGILGVGGASAGAGSGSGSGVAKTVWLCKPGMKANPCATSLKTTSIEPSGRQTTFTPRPDPFKGVDCFYVYPTVSSQPTDNATLAKDPEILEIARQQASRFSSACQVYAPVYRQATLAAIAGSDPSAAFALAYRDVRSAWREYLTKFNRGRGVILVGHSQGAGHLAELLAEEIEPRPKVRFKIASAMLLGANVTVPIGKSVGGSFREVPACTKPGQFRCVVAYSMFTKTPPRDTALFGRVGGAFADVDPKHFEVLCTDPTRLAGDKGAMKPAIRTAPFPGLLGAATPPAPDVPTPWAAEPSLYRAKCLHRDGADWLQVTDIGGPADDRTRFPETLGPDWGLHLGDVNLAVDNLVRLARTQAKAWLFESVAE